MKTLLLLLLSAALWLTLPGFANRSNHCGNPYCLGYSDCPNFVEAAPPALYFPPPNYQSGAVVVMDESVSVLEYLKEVSGFFVHES